MKNIIKSQNGYSLLQMSIALIVMGILFGAFGNIYHLHMTHKFEQTNLNNVSMVNNKVKEFRLLNGRYPCPASLTAIPTSANYGHEDCSVMAATAAGNIDPSGVWIQQSTRAGLLNNRVRAGALPFRALNIDEDKVYDAKKNRILYVVTETLIDTTTFNDSIGGVGIIDGQNQDMITPASSLHYLVLSHGKNSFGAYDLFGNQNVACAGGKLETHNCDFAADATYRSTFRGNAGNASDFDDIIRFFSRVNEPMWKRSEIDPDDIEELSLNNVAMGTNIGIQDIDIQGNIRATGSDMHTEAFCQQSGLDCFDHEVIGSATGMECPANQYMTGIANGAPQCAPVVSIRCNDNAFPIMRGIDAGTHQPICDAVPPNGCVDTTVTLCSPSDSTLLAGAHGIIRTINAGASRQRQYQCNNGAWVAFGSTTGVCNCTGGVTNTSVSACALGLSGSFTTTTSTVCPSGASVTTNNAAMACICVGGTFPAAPIPCPPGQSGMQTATITVSCPGGVTTQSPWDASACTCTPKPDINHYPGCPSGYIKDPMTPPGQPVIVTEPFNLVTCGYDPSITTKNECICNTSDSKTVVNPDPACVPGTTGTITTSYDRSGPACSWQDLGSTPSGCTAISYTWQPQGTALFNGAPSHGSSSPPIGEPCSYADHAAITMKSCYSGIPGSYDIYQCLCQ